MELFLFFLMEKALAKIKKRERKAEKLPKLKILKNYYMNILVINAGSSSLKYQIINILSQQVLAKGLAERIGIEGGRININMQRMKVLANIF